MIATFSDVHRAFLQSCVLHSILSTTQALKILTMLQARLQPDDPAPTEHRLQQLVVEINARLGKFQQQIVQLDYEPTQTTFLVFTNLSDTPLDRFQTAYPEAELSYFRVILHTLAKTDGHRLGQIECLNLTGKLEAGRYVSKSRAEELIAEWQTQGYLTLKEEEEIEFGPKAMVEFDRYLTNHFPDQVESCRLCKQVLFYGIACGQCSKIFHKICLKKYIPRMKKCPTCNKQWATSLE
ncbi:non-structural maintenance of chromosomes element 1 homolog [Topomyia yanbarensis]|uniref:non-structural maintenance of chromosomes element 1 homolog n=1 Tax=Topomyia yanbarensis TaxID=2498891 RepID=UPI00273BC188|nr:non-structural maintenance of chromosomes element 1 homolog [Topomyia yanbarensis]